MAVPVDHVHADCLTHAAAAGSTCFHAFHVFFSWYLTDTQNMGLFHVFVHDKYHYTMASVKNMGLFLEDLSMDGIMAF